MLMSGEAFKPSDLADVETPKEQRAKYIANNLRQSIKELNAIGVSLEEIITMMKTDKRIERTNSKLISPDVTGEGGSMRSTQ